MVTLTVENYVKAIYQISEASPEPTTSTGQIARVLGVSPGSVTSMLRTLSDSELVHYQAYEGVQLTEAGEQLALRVLRRHRLIEQFLVETLGLTWDEVHEEAEHLEHAISDRLVDRIDEFLKYPERDPHGDPIPRPDGSVEDSESQPLSEIPHATQFVLERVVDQSPEFLRYLGESGFRIGSEAQIIENNLSAGVIVVQVGSRNVSFGRDVANKLLAKVL